VEVTVLLFVLAFDRDWTVDLNLRSKPRCGPPQAGHTLGSWAYSRGVGNRKPGSRRRSRNSGHRGTRAALPWGSWETGRTGRRWLLRVVAYTRAPSWTVRNCSPIRLGTLSSTISAWAIWRDGTTILAGTSGSWLRTGPCLCSVYSGSETLLKS